MLFVKVFKLLTVVTKMDETFFNATDVLLQDETKFTWYDYLLFLFMLGLSSLIGIYFGCFGKKQTTAEEYLLGGKEMGVFPIAMSLIASYISGITILAVPADVYQYGGTFWLSASAISLSILIAAYTFVPVFHKLQLSSTYEYLKLRYDERVRKIASLLFAIHMFLYLPIVIYVPALALSQGTGFNVHFITPVVCGVCIFYTTLGGLKAVVWTDTLQFIVMIGATLGVTYLGTVASGGVFEIWRVSSEGGRTQIDFDIDPTKRDTFWTCFVGLWFAWLSIIGTNQGCIQKCIALPTMAHVRKAFVVFAIGMFAIVTCSVYTGLMIYTKYSKCDPLQSNVVTAHDQLLPQFVIEVARDVPGLPGLFIAGVFSAALSSLSAAMNCLSCTIYEDFISGYMPKKITQKKVSNILKLLVTLIGILCTALVFVIEHLGGILELGFSLGGVTSGPVFGLFILGMYIPLSNSKGALYGSLSSLLVMCWIVFGSQYYKLNDYFSYPTKPVSTEGCLANFTEYASDWIERDWEPFVVYRIAHYHYTIIGSTITILIAVSISLITGTNDPPVDKDLISPTMHWAIKKPKTILPPSYVSLEKGLQLLKTNAEK